MSTSHGEWDKTHLCLQSRDYQSSLLPLPIDYCSRSHSLYPTQTFETCHSDIKGAFPSAFRSSDTFLAKHVTLIELTVKQQGFQTMEGLWSVRHGWWADHQVTWCRSYKISRRHKQKAWRLNLQRNLWFEEIFFLSIYFGTGPGTGLCWVFSPAHSLMSRFP